MDEPQSRADSSLFRWLRKRLRSQHTPIEIKQVIDESEERGLIDEEQGEMIEGIFDLKETVAREIMIPRTHLVAIPADSDKDRILSAIIESGHSRIPVYDQDVDHIVCILNAKDLLPLWLKDRQEFNLLEICREPFFVPETKRVKDLLNELRARNSHIAVIVDEYGGTSGIVTMEDIVEEIIGEIHDEHDTEEELFITQEDGSVLVRARVSLDDFGERFGVSVPTGAYDTVGGFIIHTMGKVPARGEELEYGGLLMRIHAGDEKKITRVLVVRKSPESENGSASKPESDQ